LCDTFRKCGVRTLRARREDFADLSYGRRGVLDEFISERSAAYSLFDSAEPRTLYKTADSMRRYYTYLVLPTSGEKTLLFIGPYLQSAVSPSEILEISEKNSLSPKARRYLDEYYSGVSILPEASHLFVMLDTFCERIWDSPSFTIIDSSVDSKTGEFSISVPSDTDGFSDTVLSMRTLEKRYEFENEIIRAVELGQVHKEKRLLEAFSGKLFEKRNADPLQNAKNYCIIMNTLLRKAAESGGVHPMYIDKASSEFALKIERLPDMSAVSVLMREMFASYCRLVRKHSMKDLSPIVQKAVLMIDADLSANLSLATLAEHLEVSSGYLCAIFKKETGKTVSEYIREKRIKYAVHLLSTTKLQVQTIALHCGIVDIQYFSKIFKKQVGMTPNEYRRSIKNSI